MLRAGAFGGGRRGRGVRGPDAWVIMLAVQLAQRIAALENKPPVTLGVMALCAAVFYEELLPLPPGLRPPSLARGCLSPAAVLHGGQWGRLLWAALLHADEMHLLYNLSSLLVKGVQLEPRLGSARFAGLLLELALLTHGLVVAGSYAAAHYIREWRSLPASSCAVGISGVVFALKVVLQHDAPGSSQVLGFTLPTKHLAWAELLLASAFNPRASFVGHLCGILAGMLHVRCVAPALARAEQAWWQAAHQGSSSRRHGRGGGGSGGSGHAGAAQARPRQQPAEAPPSTAAAAAAAAQQRIQAAQQRGIPASRAQQSGAAAGGDAAPPLSAEDLRLRRLQRFGG